MVVAPVGQVVAFRVVKLVERGELMVAEVEP